MTGLVRYDTMCRAIAEAHDLDEIKLIRDEAAMLQAAARVAGNTQAEDRCYEIRMRAQKRAGEVSKQIKKAQVIGPGRGHKNESAQCGDVLPKHKILDNAGITTQQASEWERLADVPEEQFEAAFAENKRPSIDEIIGKSNAMAHRTNFTGNDEWFTPGKYVELAREVLGEIDLDPASHAIAQETVRAAQFFTAADDGLKQEWHGRIFLNPPYSKPLIGQFVDKLIAEFLSGNVREAIMVVNNSSDTRWFHAALCVARRVCFTKGRISFISPGGGGCSPVQGQALHYFGPNVERFEAVFSAHGAVVEPKTAGAS
jgi:phage N-6-adenine-methyltransferase